MKKILLVLVLLPGIVFATQTSVSGNASGWTYSADDTLVASDNFVIDNTTVTCKAFYIPASTSYTMGESGSSKLILTGNGLFYKDSSTGTKTLPDTISHTGTSGTICFGSMSGAYTAVGTSLEFHGTGDTLLDNKGITFEKLCICDGAKVNNIGSANSVYQSISGAPLIMMGNNTTLNLGRQISLYTTLPSRFILHGSNSLITGSAVLQMLPNGADSLFDFSRTGNGSVYIRPNQTGSSLDLMGEYSSVGLLRIYIANAYTFTFRQNDYTISAGNLDYGSSNSAATGNFYFSGIWNITGNLNATAYNSGTVNIIFGTLQANIGGNITRIAEHNITGIENTQFTLNGSGAQTVTSNGKQFGNLTVNNTGTATIKFTDSLSCLGDLSLLNGRDSLSKIRCVNYTNTTDDSVFQTDTGYVSGNWLRNNANVSRVGGRWVHVGSANTQITLQDAGTIGPITIRKSVSTATLTAASNIRAWRIKDTIGPLIMGNYSVACTTFKNYAIGTQLAAVTLDTLDQFKTMALGGGTITRWNWGANNIGANLTTGTTLTVASIDGIGGTAGALDTLQGSGGSAGLSFAGGDIRDTASYIYVANIALAAGDTLDLRDGTSIDGGGNTGAILWPSGGGTSKKFPIAKFDFQF